MLSQPDLDFDKIMEDGETDGVSSGNSLDGGVSTGNGKGDQLDGLGGEGQAALGSAPQRRVLYVSGEEMEAQVSGGW